ncbi:ThiF family adenylyltransferase [Frateuria sp. GZRe12]|uniref:ThiF family adenylyltransferase n=1 Tax=Frateuria sp. GZRe12 TaxID=3351533 RepID=UPI003EDBD067
MTAVEHWLDGPGSAFARRAMIRRADVAAEWIIDLGDSALPISSVTLRLPPNFPDRPCQLFVDRSYFLKVPHIEHDGRVCLGLHAVPGDHAAPVAAVCRAIETFKDKLLTPASDPAWCEQQFHDERASYWAQACSTQDARGYRRPVAGNTLGELGNLPSGAQGQMVAYVSQNENRKAARLQIATFRDTSPRDLATRHGWASGTEVHGQALFVSLPAGELWTPQTWPTGFSELEALVARSTGGALSLPDWLTKVGGFHIPRPREPGKKRSKAQRFCNRPTLHRPVVVFVGVGSTVFGYQLFASEAMCGCAPRIEPVPVKRIDADWALARDQELATLHARRAKRVLLLGAGSLGSPLAVAIARAGIGTLDIVDKEIFDTENVARHHLGMRARDRWKADELAAQLCADVPGLAVVPHHEDAVVWCRNNCRPDQYDLIIECTAESKVRNFMSHHRRELFGDTPIIHAWLEPLCSAGHVVLTQPDVPWPEEDPADDLVNASDLSANDTRIALPGCNSGFHPYGVADVTLVAAFAAERVLSVVDDPRHPATVWSWVRSSGFFDRLGFDVLRTHIVPTSSSAADSATCTRSLADILRPHD